MNYQKDLRARSARQNLIRPRLIWPGAKGELPLPSQSGRRLVGIAGRMALRDILPIEY